MKITIDSTTKIVEILNGGATVPARIWEGHTDSGIPVHCYITRIAVANEQDDSQFKRELQECKPPSPELQAIPLRFFLP